ncbi:MAG: glycine cleavage system aminomethyltransferase GcvT [Alphaproteobacteria bacterium]
MHDQNKIAPRHTPLFRLHQELGGRMVPFAGYELPVQYPAGILKEHLHTRSAASLFDVGHMGQCRLAGSDVAAALERLVPGDIGGLADGRMRYTQFTNAQGGILDDLMVVRTGDSLFLVVNAARKEHDFALLKDGMKGVAVAILDDLALLALQGPQAAAALQRHAPQCIGLSFMQGAEMRVAGIDCFVTRSGYTGEDGFEISAPADRAEALARMLLAEPEVAPAGLGARDSLRLEAGLCLYGHDIDETTTPIEAALAWSIGKRRREQGGFPGAAIVQRQLREGVARKRVGLLPEGKAPAREGTEIRQQGSPLGVVTSGGFGPSVNGPIAMGYVASHAATPGTKLDLVVRDVPRPARVVPLPFVQSRYKK